MSEKTVEKTAREQQESGVARTVLLSEERKEGVETTIESVEVTRAIRPKRSTVGPDELMSGIEESVATDDAVTSLLASIVYEEEDPSRFMVKEGVIPTHCTVSYRVAVTVSDTGLGRSETFYRVFKNEERAETYAEKIRAADEVVYRCDDGDDYLHVTWSGRYKDCPDVYEPSVGKSDSVRTMISNLKEDGLRAVTLGLITAVGAGMFASVYLLLPPAEVLSGVVLTLAKVYVAFSFFMALASIVTGLLFVMYGLDALSSGIGLLSPVTSEERLSLGGRGQPEVLPVDELHSVVPHPERALHDLTTYAGVTAEREEQGIRIESRDVDAQWFVETQNDVILDETAEELLKTASLDELEDGVVNLRVQEVAENEEVRAKQDTPRLQSRCGNWFLLPSDL